MPGIWPLLFWANAFKGQRPLVQALIMGVAAQSDCSDHLHLGLHLPPPLKNYGPSRSRCFEPKRCVLATDEGALNRDPPVQTEISYFHTRRRRSSSKTCRGGSQNWNYANQQQPTIATTTTITNHTLLACVSADCGVQWLCASLTKPTLLRF